MAKISLFIGGIRSLPESGRPTGMYKQPAQGPLMLGPEGFIGDQQADRRVHGGPEKAVHLYPLGHYARLAAAFPEAATALVAGSLGENISADLDESDVRPGDVWRLGSARLQVCQPRNPCWKIDERFAVEGMAAFIAEHRLTGWYWRVLTPGEVRPEDELQLETAASDSDTLAEAMALWAMHRPPLAAIRRLAATPGLAENWRQKIVQRLKYLESHPDQPLDIRPTVHARPENA